MDDEIDLLLEGVGLPASAEERVVLATRRREIRTAMDALPAPWGRSPVPAITLSRLGRPSSPPTTRTAEHGVRSDGAEPGGAPPITIAEAAARLRSGTATSRQLLDDALIRITRDDGRLGAVVARFDEAARAAATAADAERAVGVDRGPLHGVPVVVKDILTTEEGPTMAQSKVPSPYRDDLTDAVAVARLRGAGAVIVGKVSTSEYACGAPDPDAGFPLPRCPWDLDRWPGGSSSGTAVAVAAGLVPGGLGTDSGGSVRIPSALCGITGLKTTIGRIPVTGCIPLAPSLDTIGPMTHSALDCALLFDALTGEETVRSLDGGIEGLRIGFERAHHLSAPDLDPAVPGHLDALASVLGGLGAELFEVSIEGYEAIRAASLAVMYSEAFAVHRDSLSSDWERYGKETRLSIGLGALYTGADYARARCLGEVAGQRFTQLFDDVDVLVTPTVGMVAPRFDEDFRPRMMNTVFTSAWNLLGVPALTIPVGTGERGLPLGAQLIGPAGAEATLLKVGDAVQRRTAWHLRQPDPLR